MDVFANVSWTQDARRLAALKLGVAGKILEQVVPAATRLMKPDARLELDTDHDGDGFVLHVPVFCSVDEALAKLKAFDDWVIDHMPHFIGEVVVDVKYLKEKPVQVTA